MILANEGNNGRMNTPDESGGPAVSRRQPSLFTKPADFLLPLLFAIAAGIATLLLRLESSNLYRSQGAFFVLETNQNFKALQSAIGGSDGSLSGYIYALARSSSLRFELARNLNLENKPEFWGDEKKRNTSALQRAFGECLNVELEDGQLTIAARTRSPELSANLVAGLMTAIQSKLALEAKARSESLQGRLKDVEERLESSEFRMEAFREESRLIAEVQIPNRLSAVAELEKQLSIWRAQYAGLQSQASSPGGIEAMLELDAESIGKLGSLRQLESSVTSMSSELVNAPELLRKYQQLQRETVVLTRLELLANQNLEAAKLDELRELAPLRVIETPIEAAEPEPKHALRFAVGAALIGFAIGASLTWLRHSIIKQ